MAQPFNAENRELSLFAIRIRALRKRKKLTTEDVARAVNVSRQMVNRWEMDYAKPTIDKLKKLAQFLDVSIDYLVGTSEEEDLFDSRMIELEESNTPFLRYQGKPISPEDTKLLQDIYQSIVKNRKNKDEEQ